MKHLWTIALAGLALAGCQQQAADAPAEPQNATMVSPENDVAAKVERMSDQERDVVMVRAILDAGMDECGHVTKSEAVGDNTWRATCDNGAQHLVRIQPDGNAQVISRSGP